MKNLNPEKTFNSKLSSKIVRGLVFGVFDNLHPGHEFFLSETAKECDELVVVVTLPEVADLLKGKLPKKSLEERISDVKDFFTSEHLLGRNGIDMQFSVVAGDKEIGSWKVLKEYKPDVIFLGYDQQGIAKELDKLSFSYKFVASYQPEKYKSSLRK